MSEPEHRHDDRSETAAERADRNWHDLLQELRVTQTGVQLIAGFLLTLPFQSRFEMLGPTQVGLYLGLVLLAALTVGLTLTPVSVHRQLFGDHVKEWLVVSAHWVTRAVMAAMSLLVTGIVFLVFDVVLSRTSAWIAAGSLALALVLLLVVLPRVVHARATGRSGQRPRAGEAG